MGKSGASSLAWLVGFFERSWGQPHRRELKHGCHPERSEGSRPSQRSFAALRMTAGGRGEPGGVDARTGTPVLLGFRSRLWGSCANPSHVVHLGLHAKILHASPSGKTGMARTMSGKDQTHRGCRPTSRRRPPH